MPLTTTTHAEVDPLAAGLRGYYNIHRLSGAENHWATHFTGSTRKSLVLIYSVTIGDHSSSSPARTRWHWTLHFQNMLARTAVHYQIPLSLSLCELNRKSLRLLQFIETLRIKFLCGWTLQSNLCLFFPRRTYKLAPFNPPPPTTTA